MRSNDFPLGWDEERVRKVLTHYKTQTDEEAATEDKAAFTDEKRTMVEVPAELMPIVRALIGLYQKQAKT